MDAVRRARNDGAESVWMILSDEESTTVLAFLDLFKLSAENTSKICLQDTRGRVSGMKSTTTTFTRTTLTHRLVTHASCINGGKPLKSRQRKWFR